MAPPAARAARGPAASPDASASVLADAERTELRALAATLADVRGDARAARDEVVRLNEEAEAVRARLDEAEEELERRSAELLESRARAEEAARIWRAQLDVANNEAARRAATALRAESVAEATNVTNATDTTDATDATDPTGAMGATGAIGASPTPAIVVPDQPTSENIGAAAPPSLAATGHSDEASPATAASHVASGAPVVPEDSSPS